MMKRIFMLTTLALMLVAAMALTGVAQARPISDSPDAKCAKLAIKTLGASFNPSNYTFEGGTEGPDVFTGTAGTADVFCGFNKDESSGVDHIDTLAVGDIFLVGSGRVSVDNNFGTVYGGASGDVVVTNEGGGTFYGGAGDDFVLTNEGAFYGGAGFDDVLQNEAGATFDGGDGDDEVTINFGTFYGGAGDDRVEKNFGAAVGGTFYGGAGDDFVLTNFSTFYGQEGFDSVGVGSDPPVDGP